MCDRHGKTTFYDGNGDKFDMAGAWSPRNGWKKTAFQSHLKCPFMPDSGAFSGICKYLEFEADE